MKGNNEIRRAQASTVASYYDEESVYHLALLSLPNLGPVRYQKVLHYWKDPKSLFQANEKELKEFFSHQKIIEAILFIKENIYAFENNNFKGGAFSTIDLCLRWLAESEQNHLIKIGDMNYPKPLSEIYDPPPLLFAKGNVSLLHKNQLAIVGSRSPSAQGKRDAYEFSKHLVERGLIIDSGLATGIDRYAHEGALAQGEQSTIAVLAHGLDHVYPKSNLALANKISEQGLLISEFPIGVKPRPEFFPKRNRIISGLSLGVLVVEAANKSGSLITAYSALEQNREVFAIPGSIHNPVAKGCHQLIKKGAKLVESADDIVEELEHLCHFSPSFLCQQQTDMGQTPSASEKLDLRPEEKQVIALLSFDERQGNDLLAVLPFDSARLSSILTILELKGLVAQGPGGYRLQT